VILLLLKYHDVAPMVPKLIFVIAKMAKVAVIIVLI